MPPRQFSRHTFTEGTLDDAGRLFLSFPEPFGFRQLPDNRRHQVQQGETLFSIAGMFFKPLPRPAGLWWVIADFQPKPIHDPTIQLAGGRILFIPSVRTVTEEIFSEARRREITA